MASETSIISRIKYFQTEYPDGVPLNILKLELDLPVEELQQSLLSLEEQEIIFIEDGEYVKLVETPAVEEEGAKVKLENEEVNIKREDDSIQVIPEKPSIDEAKTYDLTDREMKALDIIKDLADESGHVSRYILEGALLYGELKLSSLGIYNLVMSLENKGIIKKIQVNGSEYYTI